MRENIPGVNKAHESYPADGEIDEQRPIARGTINKHLRKRQLDIVREIALLQAEYDEITRCVQAVTNTFK